MDELWPALPHFDSHLCDEAHEKATNDIDSRAAVTWLISEYQDIYRRIRKNPVEQPIYEARYNALASALREYIAGESFDKSCKDNGI